MRNFSISEKLPAIAKWIGLQLAAKAFQWVLGLPFVATAAVSFVSFLAGVPFVWILVLALGVLAFVSIVINLLWAFSAQYGLDGMLNIIDVQIEGARSTTSKQTGYGVLILFQNAANFKLQYAVTRCTAHIDRKIILPEENLSTAYDVAPVGNNAFGLGIAEMDFRPNTTLHGELEIEFRYGRPGKLKVKQQKKYRLLLETDASGDARESRIYSAT